VRNFSLEELIFILQLLDLFPQTDEFSLPSSSAFPSTLSVFEKPKTFIKIIA
jgi:hypothetical protein